MEEEKSLSTMIERAEDMSPNDVVITSIRNKDTK